jgi:formylglycine-generating enzyme required for sulfatase activity
MFNPRSLRSAFILAIATMLASGCDKAPEYEGDGPKMEFVRIPAGSFRMGSPASEECRDDNEGPVHEVRITKPFYMGKYEVTQAQWKTVMGTTVGQQRDKYSRPLHLKGEGPEHPIYYVSWEEAVEFCKRLGRKFRLPTEAEWEYACRAGSRTRFYYGDYPNYSELDQYAWYYGKSDNKTHPVGQKKPNAWGLHDMHGNVNEWCSDRDHVGNNYENAESVDPTGSAIVTYLRTRIHRGGNWLGKPKRCRSANREVFPQAGGYDLIGFRVVFAGKVRGDSKVLEIALPQKTTKVPSAPEQDRDNQRTDGRVVTGVVRDEAGLPTGDVDMWIIPRGWGLRRYAEGEFEAFYVAAIPESKSRFVARHREQNLAVAVEIDQDRSILDVKLKPGVILSGRVMDGAGKGIEEARVVITPQTYDRLERYLNWSVETDAEGRFEMRALPPGYGLVLSAKGTGYRPGRIDVHTDDVRGNRVDAVSIVLARGQFSISGVVVDVNGKPMPDVRVFCYGKDQPYCYAATRADGRFTIEGVFKGQVEVQGQGYGFYGLADAEAGATDIRIVLDKKLPLPGAKGRACFPGETGIWIDGAVVPISKVARGQTVGKPGCFVSTSPLGQIEKIEEHVGIFECRDIVLENGNRISVVDAHCFMLDSGQWIAAQDFKKGLILKTLNGTVTIKSVTTRPTPFVGKVYNLKVKSSDRYMVGKDGVIVRDY